MRELEYNCDMAAATTGLKITYDLRKVPPDPDRYELINGEIVESATPDVEHQRGTGRLFRRLADHVEQHDLGEVLIGPCHVVLDADTRLDPDIMFISKDRFSIVKPEHVAGAPDLVVEVTSEWTRMIDRLVKRDRYLEFGVQEYWLLDPFEPRLEVRRPEGTKYRVVAEFGPGDTIESLTFPGLRIPVSSL
ncbi:MAG TPA: Uma2 family endonuclease [Terriglobia bacterium]|nr:Uma2 family endonuclease [Terriglobia bacterium]